MKSAVSLRDKLSFIIKDFRCGSNSYIKVKNHDGEVTEISLSVSNVLEKHFLNVR